jgi:hypothetical protein
VIGRALRVDGERFPVVGVLPRGFSFLSSKRNLFLPLATDPRERDPSDVTPALVAHDSRGFGQASRPRRRSRRSTPTTLRWS